MDRIIKYVNLILFLVIIYTVEGPELMWLTPMSFVPYVLAVLYEYQQGKEHGRRMRERFGGPE